MALLRSVAVLLTITLLPGLAAAQGVDRYVFLQLEKQVQQMDGELQRLRNAVDGADQFQRFQQLEAEIQRLTRSVEELSNRQRRHEAEMKVKLEDYEFRIVTLEGGDPSYLFEDEQQQGSSDNAAPSGGTLGVLTTTSQGSPSGRAEFDAGVNAVQAGRLEEAQSRLSSFMQANPGDPLAGEASFWLGEANFASGEYNRAANRYLAAVTDYPSNARAADAMVGLGGSLMALGKFNEACSTYREVISRYSYDAGAVAQADAEASRNGC